MGPDEVQPKGYRQEEQRMYRLNSTSVRLSSFSNRSNRLNRLNRLNRSSSNHIINHHSSRSQPSH